jgi:NADPH:quinone reductase-like Zn-dependent oxidoreductase
MRAAAMDRFGPADVLQVRPVPRPSAGPGEVLVRVEAAGVQITDAAIRGGWTPPGATIVFPQVLGNEFAGVVVDRGPDVTATAIGDEVVGFRTFGCYAQLVAVPESHVAPKPRTMSWLQAGALSASGQTAHTALEALRISAGETVLVHGAAGGVGTVFVQLAVARGARVVGTASPQNHDHVRSLGAEVVAYGDGQHQRLADAAPGGYDAAFDTAGHENLRTATALVEDRSRVATIVDYPLAERLGCRFVRSDRSVQRLRHLTAAVEQGRLHVHVRRVYDLSDAAGAHRDVESGHGRGKVVLRVRDDPESGAPS